ncbi:VOC family protein [Nocardiopsis alborubida]|uniref:VOC family protein n=1 Tax=Nocardiopsis alborubida TaxID=146802 RepID=UPI001B34F3D0|nr:VOC family protein [Nocardiopsis alborubida]
MTRMTFVNLPVKSVDATREFFSALGFGYDEAFSDDKALCMVVSDQSRVLFLSEPFFAEFTPSGIADTSAGAEVITCLSADSREDVDRIAEAAAVAGATHARSTEHTGMYSRSFADPDGHLWEFLYMDATATIS